MLSFKIGQRESGFYSERTDRQNHRVPEPSSTVLVYRYINSIFFIHLFAADILKIYIVYMLIILNITCLLEYLIIMKHLKKNNTEKIRRHDMI